MTLLEIQTNVGRKCSLIDGSDNFVDGLVTAADITALANIRWRELHVKYTDRFPDDSTLEIYKNLVEDQADYELSETGIEEYILPYVGIKYASTDEYYTKVRRSRYNKLNKTSTRTDTYSQTSPFYMEVPSRQDAVGSSSQQHIKKAVRLRPIPDAAITDGLLIKMVEMPAKMAIDDDVPYTLPEAAHSLIVSFVVSDVWEIKRDWANSNEAINRAYAQDKHFFSNYQPTTADRPVTFDIGKTFDPYAGR